jgi:imidazolonepropionase-like amidohydrolase
MQRDRRRPPTAFAVAVLSLLASPTPAAPPRVYAITHANVVPAPGERIEDGTVVLRDGLIEAVGRNVPIPPDATEIDVAGSWVHAGLIDADPGVQLVSAGGRDPAAAPPAPPPDSVAGPPQRRDPAPGAVHELERVRAEKRARDDLLPFAGEREREMLRLRDLGFTTVLAAPASGLFRGRSAAIQLASGRPVAQIILRDDVFQHVALERGSFGEAYPTSLMGAAAAIRQTLLDARRHELWTERYAGQPVGLRRPDRPAAYEALRPVLAGEQSLHVRVDEPDDTLLADRLARECEVDVVISVSGAEWEIADRVAATGRTLLVPVAFPEKPKVKEDHEALEVPLRTLRRYVEAAAGPGRLHAAGVRFALTTRDLKNTADFPDQVRKVVAAGLPRDAALAALTTVPAAILGLDATLGSIAPGKIANLVVAAGAPFGEGAEPTRVFVDGVPFEIEKPDVPQGDPDAVVDPRGEWSVVLELGSQTVRRTWTITGEPGRYAGTGETGSGTVEFESVKLEGNVMTVILPGQGGRGPTTARVIVEAGSFEGSAESGSRSVPVEGTRARGPGGDGR